MGDYKWRLTSANKQDKCVDPVTGEPIDIVVKYKERSIARIQRVNEGVEQGIWNCNTFWYPPCLTIQSDGIENGKMAVIELHEAKKGEIQSYYHPIE